MSTKELKRQEAQELQTLDSNIISSLVINGDLAKLTPDQKVQFYNYRCHQAGIDPAAKPFDLLKLNGKEILYANATCTQQLCATRGLSVSITNKEGVNGLYMVWAKVTDREGRSTENMGAVTVDNLKGDSLANAIMKAHTKATRRTVLAHCGLGMLDETETETIPNTQRMDLTDGQGGGVVTATGAHPAATVIPDAPQPLTIEPEEESYPSAREAYVEAWYQCVEQCTNKYQLNLFYAANRTTVDNDSDLQSVFKDRQAEINKSSKSTKSQTAQAA